MAIATEMEFELLPKSEPGFFQVSYNVNDVLSDNGGKKLMQDLWDVVADAGVDPDLDCGILYSSHHFPGTFEGAVSLKCADWASRDGANVRRYAPPGYKDFKPKKSGFLTW